MTKRILTKLLTVTVIVSAVAVTSCKKNLTPQGAITTASVYKDFANYKPVLAKLYTAFALSGQTGPAAPAPGSAPPWLQVAPHPCPACRRAASARDPGSPRSLAHRAGAIRPTTCGPG